MSARDTGHANKQGELSARRSARLFGTATHRSEYDESRHPNDDQLPRSDDTVVSGTSDEAPASKPKAIPAKGQAKASSASIIDSDDEEKPTKRHRSAKTKPKPALVGTDDEVDSDDRPLKPSWKKVTKRQPRRTSSDVDQMQDEKDSDDEILRPRGEGRATAAFSTGRLPKSSTGSAIHRRRREIRADDLRALPRGLLGDEEFKALAPSMALPETKQELRETGMWNLYKLSDKLSNLVIPNEAPPKWEKAVYTINQVATLPLQTGRDFQCTNIVCKRPAKDNKFKSWVMTFRNKSSGKAFTPRSLNNLVEQALANKQEAEQVANRICEYLNRWPVPLPSDPADENIAGRKKIASSPHGWFWPLVAFVAFFDLKPTHDNSVVTVMPKSLTADPANPKAPLKQSMNLEYNNKGGFWNVVTCCLASMEEDWSQITKPQHPGVRIRLNAKEVDDSVVIPETPSWWPKEMPSLEKVSASERTSVQRSVNLAHWLAFKLHGSFGTKDAQKRALQALRAPFLRSRHSRIGGVSIGVYGGRNLLNFTADNRNTRVGLSTSIIFNKMKGGAGTVSIRGMSRTRLAFVMEAITAKFLSGHGVAASMKHGALVADLLNLGKISREAIMESVRVCETTPHFGRPHVCQGCTSAVDCADMAFTEEGYRLCQTCIKGNVHNIELQRKRRLPQRAHTSMLQDARKVVIPKENIKRHVKAVRANLAALYDGSNNAYPDAYARGTLRKDVNESETHMFTKRSNRIGHPFQASVDAVFPMYFDEEEDRLYYHHPENVAVTAIWLNRMKQNWVPAILELVKEYRRLTLDLNLSREKPDVQDVLRRLDHVYVIAVMTPRNLKTRLTGTMKRDVGTVKRDVTRLHRQWLSALADPDEQSWKFWTTTGLIRGPEATQVAWKPPRLQHVERIISQMEQKYRRKVPRIGAQQVPWLWLQNHRFEAFTWKSLYQVIGGRLDRLDDWCDEEEEHVDESSDTLLLEYIRQYLEFSGKDEFLGLPMTLFERHPLCFAVAHLLHGRKMRTGFKTADPTDLYEDYDQSLSNISFEPQVSNYAKHNYSVDVYGLMLEDLMSIDVPQRYYQRSFATPVQEITQLSFLNNVQALEQDENVESDSDVEWESDNEINEDEQDDADNGQVAAEEADSSDAQNDDADDGDIEEGDAEEAEPSDYE